MLGQNKNTRGYIKNMATVQSKTTVTLTKEDLLAFQTTLDVLEKISE